MTAAARPVARLTSPGELAAIVPVLCGFVPHESLVVVSLRGPRRQVGLAMRFDLDWARDGVPAAAAEVADRLALDGGTSAVLVVLSDEPDEGDLAWTDLVDDVSLACEQAGTPVVEALLVRDGRWWSYLCQTDSCCPAAGTPLAAGSTEALRLVEAERVLEGRAVLGSREELVRSLAPPVLLAAASAEQHLDRAFDAWLDRRDQEGPEALREYGVQAARRLLTASLTPEGVTAAEAAQFAMALGDVLVRDEIATWALTRGDALLALLMQVARQVVSPEDAPVCALIAWVAYVQGDGGLANVALDRALASVPTYSLAQLLRQMLDAQVPPTEIRRLLEATRKALGC